MNGIATFFRESKTARFLIPLGIILIIVSILLFIIGNNNKNYIKIESTVSKVELVKEETTDSEGNTEEAIYDIYVKYTVDGKEYDTELGEMSKRKVGDKITIVYNPDNPSEISQPSSIILNICLLVGGIVSLVGGIISSINAVKRYKKMKTQEEGWNNGQ
jgi:hypothetical protein